MEIIKHVDSDQDRAVTFSVADPGPGMHPFELTKEMSLLSKDLSALFNEKI
jgi:hypothetical protein